MKPSFAANNNDTLHEVEVPPTYKLAFNELLMVNGSAIADNDGEYDPYLELFNNSDSTYQLNKLYLTNDRRTLNKWQFPESEIVAKGHLLVWIDGNKDQDEVHASFKPDANGDALYISDAFGTIIDSLKFDQQTKDISIGRYPDGTGDWIEMSPTPELANIDHIIETVGTDLLSPTDYIMLSAAPNPFNPSTTISFKLAQAGQVSLEIFNIMGQRIVSLAGGRYEAGNYQVRWNGEDSQNSKVRSGLYFVTLRCGQEMHTQKVVLLK